jgi:methionine aminopeptidase
VVTKYRKAADIANLALSKVASLCVPDALIVDICKAGDDIIREETGKVYNKGSIEKGVGFPTCINVNNICGHYSPLVSDPETRLKEGDVVKM